MLCIRSASRPSQRIAYLPGVEVVAGPASELADRVAAVDMIVTDRQPSELGLLGLDFAAVRAARPEVIVVSVTPFGLTGPDADLPTTNAVSFAAGGIMSLTGDADRPPLVTGGEHAYALGGANAFAAAAVAWLGRARTGRGDLVDISLQECAAGMLEYYGPITSYLDTPAQLRLGNRSRATWGIYPCLDGWAGVFASGPPGACVVRSDGRCRVGRTTFQRSSASATSGERGRTHCEALRVLL